MYRCHIPAAAALLALLLAGPGQAQATADQEALQGDWEPFKVETMGKEAPEAFVKMSLFHFKSDKLTIHLGTRKDQALFRLDPAKAPRTIDVTALSEPDKGKVSMGIYQLEGDTLKLCVAEPGDPRPTDFTAPSGSRNVLIYLRRAKKK